MLHLGKESQVCSSWVHCEWRQEEEEQIADKVLKLIFSCKKFVKLKLTFSGFWGVSRHMNYVFELMLAFSWSCPALGYGVYPFFYWWFLLILLVHRYIHNTILIIMMIVIISSEPSGTKRNVEQSMEKDGIDTALMSSTEWYHSCSDDCVKIYIFYLLIFMNPALDVMVA